MSRSSISVFGHGVSPRQGRRPATSRPARFSGQRSACCGELRDDLVVVRRDEAGAGVDVHRRKAEHDLLAEAEDRQVALQERLLVGGELHPAALERLDDLRAGVEAEVEDLARLLAGRLHVGRHVAEHLAAGIADQLGVGVVERARR